jgi:hypothetical protein
MMSAKPSAGGAWAGLISDGSANPFTRVPSQETEILRLDEWRSNVVVKGGFVGDANMAAQNSLVRLYARGKGGIRAEVGRGRFNARPVRQSLGPGNVSNLTFVQPLITCRIPPAGESLSVTWIADPIPGVSSGDATIAKFEISAWGTEPGSPTDDSTPAQAVAEHYFNQTSGAYIAPAIGGGSPDAQDSYLIEALFTNRAQSDAWVYFVDNVGFSGPTAWIQLTPGIRVIAGATASYTPRRPIYATTQLQMIVTSSSGGPSAGEPALVDALVTWV